VSGERDWIEQALAGDRAAFGRLVEAYVVHCVRVFLQMMTAGGLLLKAMRLWLESVTSPSVLSWLLAYVCVMLVLTALWGWLVGRRYRQAPGLLILIAGG